MNVEDDRDYTLVNGEAPAGLAFKKVEYTELYCRVECRRQYKIDSSAFIQWDHITLSVPGYELTNRGPVANPRGTNNL